MSETQVENEPNEQEPSDPEAQPTAEQDEQEPSNPEAQPTAESLRLLVVWLAVVAIVFAAGNALGLFFGMRYYFYASSAPDSMVLGKYLHGLLIGIAEKAFMAGAFVYLARNLFRYARVLARPAGDGGPDDGKHLLAAQSACWQALLWAALLYTGWGLVGAIASVR